MLRRAWASLFVLLASACGGASAGETPAASSGGESSASAPAALEAGDVIEIRPFAFTAGPDGELLRLLEDGTIVLRGSRSGRLAADGRIVEADIDLSVDAAGDIRMGGEVLAHVDGARMSFVGESTTFEIVPGALQIATEGEVERLDLEGNPPPRTALLLAVLLMFANGAAGP